MSKYSIGIDFGSLSARALIVDVADGKEIISKVSEYRSGCMSEQLPSGVRLGVDWALQDAEDYITSMCEAVSGAMSESAIDKKDIVGIGIDFTACTVVAAKADGTPLSSLPEYRDCPHAYVKLWMHHAAVKQAERINAIGADLAASWMKRYSGKMSSEFMFPKILQVVEEAPEIYDAADLFMEGGDWTVWQMTGN
ncbi:MAG: FGGY family carbohydrate kinase, partial [Lachnospiraceae bacterium]|nr:FGGY family carbohydrate kinase [Lachnospiraceae bacterium]